MRKLHLVQDGEIANAKGSENEIRALLEIRHRNVEKLFVFCSHPRQSFLVYEFLEGDSMKDLLSNKEEVVSFD